MAKEDLGKLSPEQLKKLATTISEAKSLTSQQAEVIEQVLSGEHDIGKLRISYLEQYFDKYSKGLDRIARKCREELDDTFQILDRKFAESFETFDGSASKAESKKQKQDRKETSSQAISGSKEAVNTIARESINATKTLTSSINELTKQLKIGFASNAGGTTSGSTTNGITNTSSDNKSATSATDNYSSKDTSISVTPQDAQDAATTEKLGKGLSVVDQESLAKEQAERIVNLENSIYDSKQKLEFELALSKQNSAERFNEYQLTLEKRRVDAQLKLHETTEKLAFEKSKGYSEKLKDLKISQAQSTADAELALLELLNTQKAEDKFYQTKKGASLHAKEVNTKDSTEVANKLAENKAKWIAKQELEAKRKNNGILSKEEAARIQKEAANKFKFDKENLEKLNKERVKLEAAKSHADERNQFKQDFKTMTSAETFEERKQALKNMTHNEAGEFDMGKTMSAALTVISDLAKQLEKSIDEIAKNKSSIDTRLQGSRNDKWAGSYWDQLNRDMMSIGAVTPLYKQEDFANNIKELVSKGISFDLKQRAFLMTIQEKIANTFNVADGTLLRLIRIQQEDSTAGRLGMESALNSFLNNMYENTEYLQGVAENVRGSLQEMEALMAGAAATEVEYQVQKWMGSLYSVGMSQEAVQGIATALGQIASGQVDGLTGGSGAGNLLVMAANKSGKSIADILTEGLNADETNKLLQSTVEYLAEIANSTKGNNVVQQQLANVFGIKASDIKAAVNLAAAPGSNKNSIGDIADKNLSYSNMLNQLYSMAGSMAMRTSIGEMMSNVWENGQYTAASSIANNPVSYLIYKLAGLLDSAVGGIDLPFVNVMGFGIDLNTTVSDLMRLGAVGGGLLSSLGPMISGLASSFSGKAMLRKLGIDEGSGLQINTRGGSGIGASPLDANQSSPSESGYVGNANSSDVKNSTIQSANDDKKKQMIKAKEEEPSNQVDILNNTVIKIYELLDDVATGSKTLRVRIDNYGLTGLPNSSSQSNTAGLGSTGSSSLGGNSSSGDSLIPNTNMSSDPLSGSYPNGSNSSGGGVNLGGWTLV